MTAYVAPGEWSGEPLERPGLMLRKWQVEEILAADQAAEPEREPDRVLAHRFVSDLAELAAMVGGAKALLGVTKAAPRGQLGPEWRWTASHGYGQDGGTGRIRESVLVKLERPGRRVVAWWSRPVPHPAVMLALTDSLGRIGSHIRAAMALRLAPQLKDPAWSAELLAAGPIDDHGRFVDTPRQASAVDIRKELKS